jgi:hypothetical protein
MKQTRLTLVLTALAMFFFVPLTSNPLSANAGGVVPIPRDGGMNNNLTIDLYPQRNTNWVACSFTSQTYCFEQPTVITADGAEVAASATPSSNCHNNVTSTELCAMDGSDWLEVGLSGNFSEATSQSIFRWKLRTGKLSPDIFMLGDTQKTVIGGNATDGWTIEIWAKPALKAYLNGCYSASSCPDTSVASSASYGISGYLRMLGVNNSWPSVATESLRNALRGTFISTNGMSQSWSFSVDTFSVNAVSPHLLPPDSSGNSAITPGYVKIFLPDSYFLLDRGYNDLSSITAENMNLVTSGQTKTAKLTKANGGILVDTGVEHFSSVNVTLRVLTKNTSATVSNPTSATVSNLRRGSSKALSSIVKTKTTQKPKWSASGKCKIVGSKLVALKVVGNCKVTLRVLDSKNRYVIQTTKNFRVT